MTKEQFLKFCEKYFECEYKVKEIHKFKIINLSNINELFSSIINQLFSNYYDWDGWSLFTEYVFHCVNEKPWSKDEDGTERFRDDADIYELLEQYHKV